MAIPLKYNLRSVMLRRTSALMAVLSVAATVAVFISVMALGRGLETAFTSTGDPLNLVVIRLGSQVETNSSVERDKVQTLRFLPGIAHDAGGEPLVSPEIQVLAFLPRTGGERANVLVRGISPAGLVIRSQVALVEGRLFHPGVREVIAGRSLARRFGLELGKPLRLEGGSPWQVVGFFDGGSTAYDSEIWTDVNSVASEFKRLAFSSVLLRAADATAQAALARRIGEDRRLHLQARPEPEYFRDQNKNSVPIKALGTFIAVIMAVGACFAAMNAMYASVAYRAREIATLRVLGFGRPAVLGSFLFESVVLAAAGGAIGCVLALPIHGISTGTVNFSTFAELAFHFRITPEMLVIGLAFALIMGGIGGILPAVLASRRAVVQSLRGQG
jgi:putative ABC transport system permease protein